MLNAKNPHELFFVKLPEICLNKSFSIKQKIDIQLAKKFVLEFEAVWNELKTIYSKMIDDIKKEIVLTFDLDPTNELSFKKIRKRAENISNNKKVYNAFSNTVLIHKKDKDWIESIIAFAAEKPVQSWNDLDMQKAQLKIIDIVLDFLRIERLLEFKEPSENSLIIDYEIRESNKKYNLKKLIQIESHEEKEIEDLIIKLEKEIQANTLSKNGKLVALLKLLQKNKDPENIKKSKGEQAA